VLHTQIQGTRRGYTSMARLRTQSPETSTRRTHPDPQRHGRATGEAAECSQTIDVAVTRACLHRTHSHEVRLLLALEMAARKVLSSVRLLSASPSARLHFASCMLCTGLACIHLYTYILAIYIYIYIYISHIFPHILVQTVQVKAQLYSISAQGRPLNYLPAAAGLESGCQS
jgi:hypothetical protein